MCRYQYQKPERSLIESYFSGTVVGQARSDLPLTVVLLVASLSVMIDCFVRATPVGVIYRRPAI
jgi:hypothetical protein